MAESNLQAVLKDVERAGTSFQQKYWVSVDEVKKLVKDEGWDGAITKMGGSLGQARGMLKSWTSASTSVGGLKLQGAAAAVMGGKPEDWPVGKHPSHVETLKAGHGDTALQKTVVALHAVTRAGLENKGYKPRTMYRGMGGDIADKLLVAAKAQADAGVPYHEAAMNLRLNPGSSFSEKEDRADDFGSAVVAIHEVPAHAYIAHYKVQGVGTVGYKSEHEGIIAFQGEHTISVQDIRGPHADKIISYFKEKGLYDAAKVDLDDHPPSKTSMARIGKTLPPRPKVAMTVDVPLLVKVPANLTKQQVQEHLTSSGATFKGLGKYGTDTLEVTVPSHKINSFTEEFSKTPAFDASLHKPESLKAYMATKANSIASKEGAHFEADFGKGGEPTPAAAPAPHVPKPPKPPSSFKGILPSVSELPDLPEEMAKTQVQQKKGKGAVPEWGGKKTWRDLWPKWAKQEAVAAGHHPSKAKDVALEAVNKTNLDLKKFVHHTNPSKAQFKAFFSKVVKEHVKK